MTHSVTITLPYPHRCLNPNRKSHYLALSQAKRRARNMAGWLTLEAGAHKLDWSGDNVIIVQIVGYPKDRRRRDADNLIASCKAHLDGIAKTIGVDDRRFYVGGRIAEETRNPPVVEITLSIKN